MTFFYTHRLVHVSVTIKEFSHTTANGDNRDSQSDNMQRVRDIGTLRNGMSLSNPTSRVSGTPYESGDRRDLRVKWDQEQQGTMAF